MRYFYLLLILALAGCDSSGLVQDTLSTDPINLSDLRVGQKSVYIGFEALRVNSDESTFSYIPDTLIVEVTEKRGNAFVLKESITPGSDSYQTRLQMWTDLTYLVEIENDSLQISQVSDLSSKYALSNLFRSTEHKMPLQHQGSTKFELDGARVTGLQHTGIETGHIINHRQFERVYPQLNLYIDVTDTYVDGPGNYMVYSNNAGMVRTFSISSWTNHAQGWDLR